MRNYYTGHVSLTAADSQIIQEQIHALKTRQKGAIEALIDAHSKVLLSAAYGMGFAGPDAEELVQDTFVSFLDALGRFEGRSQLRTFLFGILYNKVTTLRRQRRRESADDEIEQIFEKRFDARGLWATPPTKPDEELVNRELGEWIMRCSDGLAAQMRAAFYMKTVEGEETETICKMLDISPTNLGVLLYRARLKLRECLERQWGKPE